MSATPSISPMPLDLPEGAARPFDAPGLARALLREIRTGALGTNDPASGHPLVTLVTVATDVDGSPLLLLSGLSLHTRNIAADPRASLLLAATGKGDPLAHPRLTLVGRFAPVDAAAVRRRFLARHPKAELYVGLPDFRFLRMTVTGVHLNGGFARAAALTPADVILDMTGAEEIAAIEEGAVAHMNADHADALALYAGAPGTTGWTCTGVDPDGIDLMRADQTLRVPFPERVSTGRELRLMLKRIADAARAR